MKTAQLAADVAELQALVQDGVRFKSAIAALALQQAHELINAEGGCSATNEYDRGFIAGIARSLAIIEAKQAEIRHGP